MKIRIREAALALFAIFSIVVIIFPPGSLMLSFLLMLSLFIGLVIMLNAVYAVEPLEMSFFPTILLLTTLFRLVLSVAATRKILGSGEGGPVIDAFANFVTGGGGNDNIVVGAVVFLIIVLVNFLVITKGSERVAEVTARFTLDAMPGKQMAVDADLNAGLITQEEAKARRKKISDEATFYGAMDGSAKFVKGDAIAGILIAAINFIGGVAVGAFGMAGTEAMSVGTAAVKFGMLTIGSGLVSQIPALMISVATGILITKSASEKDVSQTVLKQLFGLPVVLILSGISLVFLGLFTPLPWYVFVPFGLILAVFGYNRSQKKAEEPIKIEKKADSLTELLDVSPILFQFGFGLIPYVDREQGGSMIDRVAAIKRKMAAELGMIIPAIRIQDDIKLRPNEYKIFIKGVETARGEILFDHYMALNPGDVEEEIDGIETVEPYFHIPAMWIAESQRERAESLGYQIIDPQSVMTTHLSEIIKENLHELITRQDTQSLIENIKIENTVLIEEIAKQMPVGEIQKVLANLLREGVSIRDFVTILETLADNSAETKDTDILTERVRESLKRSISKTFFRDGLNMVVTLDPIVEQELADSIEQNGRGSFLALNPTTAQDLFEKIKTETEKLAEMGSRPIILTSPLVRIYFKRLIEPIMPGLVVLGYNEIDNAEIQSVGMVS